jgi:methyl-accepting chemotaxis protein
MLDKLVPDIQKTGELVQQITAASLEQDTGAEQINKALQQLERVIQQNASASEEMAATTEELSAQPEQLVGAWILPHRRRRPCSEAASLCCEAGPSVSCHACQGSQAELKATGTTGFRKLNKKDDDVDKGF